MILQHRKNSSSCDREKKEGMVTVTVKEEALDGTAKLNRCTTLWLSKKCFENVEKQQGDKNGRSENANKCKKKIMKMQVTVRGKTDAGKNTSPAVSFFPVFFSSQKFSVTMFFRPVPSKMERVRDEKYRLDG